MRKGKRGVDKFPSPCEARYYKLKVRMLLQKREKGGPFPCEASHYKYDLEEAKAKINALFPSPCEASHYKCLANRGTIYNQKSFRPLARLVITNDI